LAPNRDFSVNYQLSLLFKGGKKVMPIGDYYYVLSKNRFVRLVIKSLGVFDYHSHIRLKPLIKFLSRYIKRNNQINLKILEIGCGSGMNAFEIIKNLKMSNLKHGKIEYVGLDIDKKSIEVAQRILNEVFVSSFNHNIKFLHADAREFLQDKQIFDQIFDIVLLIDVIEHIKEPELWLESCNKILKDEGLYIISVPTPLYPKIFGREFHISIGHVKDGYTLDELDDLFSKLGCERLYYSYNTGLLGNIGCYLFYNRLKTQNKYINFIKFLFLYPFLFLDFYNNYKVSSSLFAVYRKKKKNIKHKT
jgi:SAM-dependent methyltransferase